MLAAGLLFARIMASRAAGARASALAGRARAELGAVKALLDQHAIDHGGTYPAALADVPALSASILVDPWGRPYVYAPPSAPRGTPLLGTYGADGRPGGTGEDADVLWR